MKISGEVSAFKPVLMLPLMLGLSTFVLISFHDFIERHRPRVEESINLILKQVLPRAVEFRPVFDKQGWVIYYNSFAEDGSQIGYSFIITGPGMWGEIKYSGGLDLNFRLTGVKILAHEETPALGSRIEEPWFLEQFKGLEAAEVELTRYGGKVDAITGATTTCKAVVDAIKREMAAINATF